MDDEFKKEILLKSMCVECLESRRYRFDDGTKEGWYCPHKQTLTIWRQDIEPHEQTIFDVSDKEFFSMLNLAKKMEAQAQARMN